MPRGGRFPVTKATFSDTSSYPSSGGQLQRNGNNLVWHDGTNAIIVDKSISSIQTPILEARLLNAGSTAIILPFGMPTYGEPDAATFTGAGDEQPVFTWSETPSTFDTPLDLSSPLSYQGIAPFITFNGTNEEADSPDASHWDMGNGATDEAFSVVFWAKLGANNAEEIIGKKTGANSAGWSVGTRRMTVTDLVATARVCRRDRDISPALGTWLHLAMTYDGSGGGTAANGMLMYENGTVQASTATNSASYVALDPNGAKVDLAYSKGTAAYLNGSLGGGPCGLMVVKAVLTADQILRDFNLTRGAMDV